MDLLTGSLSSCNEQEVSQSSLIDGLTDDLLLFCLARISRKYHSVLKCVSKRWRDLVVSDEWRDYRKKHNLSETWIYSLCRDKFSDQMGCYKFDPSSARLGNWKSVRDLPPRCVKRKGMCFEVLGNKLFLLGGCAWSEDATDEVYYYDATMDTWNEAASMPTARCYFGCAAMNGKIYAIGGYGLETNDPRCSWDLYDSCSDTWESHLDSDIILDIEDSIVMDGKVYIRSRTSTIPPHVHLAVYDSSVGKWQEADAGMALGWQGPAVVVDNNLYVLDQRSGTRLMMWLKEDKDWVAVCRLSPILTRPPCQMVAVGKTVFIIGRGLSTVILDVGNVGNTDLAITSASIPVLTSECDVISCRCVSI